MSKIVKKEILRLFPSLVFKGLIDDHTVIDRASEQVNSLKKSKIGSLTREKFTTDDNLHELPQFAELTEIILEETRQVLDFYAVVRETHYITNMWAHSTANGHRHSFIHSPEKGVMLIWNSWLPHSVDQSSVLTEEERVVIAFNIMIKGSVQRKSEQIVF